MNDRMKAAVIGGALAGVLSAIPVIGGCCFLWALAGGALAVYMYLKNSPTPLMMGDGAKIGATVGGIGAVIFLIIRVPLLLLGVGTAAMNDQLRNSGIGAGFVAVAGTFGMVLAAVIIVASGVLGGVLGVALFGKNQPGGPSVPPPPPNYGGPSAGGGTGAGGFGVNS